jgi:GT2 family glycosyltransferase
VVDGGSVDATRAIAARYDCRVIDAPGLGQAAAINLGVREAHGETIIVLNGDDVLEPNAATLLLEALDRHVEAVAAYGNALHIDAKGSALGPYPTIPFDRSALLEACFICQPASAFRRSAFLRIGGMDERLDVALDYDLWIRLAAIGTFTQVDAVLAGSRMHGRNKTLSRRQDVYREVIAILRRHFGYVPYTWSYAYANWLLERRDQFFAPAAWPRASMLLSLVVGAWLNPRQVARYAKDWYQHRGIAQPVDDGSSGFSADGWARARAQFSFPPTHGRILALDVGLPEFARIDRQTISLEYRGRVFARESFAKGDYVIPIMLPRETWEQAATITVRANAEFPINGSNGEAEPRQAAYLLRSFDFEK